MSKVVLPLPYFGNIEFFWELFHNDEIIFEEHENFIKQTYRTRSYIYGANGKLALNVPVIHGKGRKIGIKDLKISYSENWQKLHWKSIESAYRSSAFFEYYEPELRDIFNKKWDYLIDLNYKSLEFLLDALDETLNYKGTSSFEADIIDAKDLRKLHNPKQPLFIAELKDINYFQVFKEKHGFIPNLSLLDLLFNEGPNTMSYFQ